MKSPVAHGAGNINLKGKKYKLLRCGCCEVIDFREDYKKYIAKKEIQNAKRGIDV